MHCPASARIYKQSHALTAAESFHPVAERRGMQHAGMLPFARELIKMGTIVILAANEVPSINDITHRELKPLLQQVAQFDHTLGAALSLGRLQAVSSGNDLPVIDLSKASLALHVHRVSHMHHGMYI